MGISKSIFPVVLWTLQWRSIGSLIVSSSACHLTRKYAKCFAILQYCDLLLCYSDYNTSHNAPQAGLLVSGASLHHAVVCAFSGAGGLGVRGYATFPRFPPLRPTRAFPKSADFPTFPRSCRGT